MILSLKIAKGDDNYWAKKILAICCKRAMDEDQERSQRAAFRH